MSNTTRGENSGRTNRRGGHKPNGKKKNRKKTGQGREEEKPETRGGKEGRRGGKKTESRGERERLKNQGEEMEENGGPLRKEKERT